MPERYRIVEEASIYFVTYTVVEWLPVFTTEAACQIVTESMNYCHEGKGLCTNGFVIMPTHMHAIFFDELFDNERLQKSLADFRKFTGRRMCEYIDRYMSEQFSRTLRTSSTAGRERRFWQPSRHVEGIQSERFWEQKLNYIHDNPCRKGFVSKAEDWRYSSAKYYYSDAVEECDVRISPLDWS
jgi:putative transposase